MKLLRGEYNYTLSQEIKIFLRPKQFVDQSPVDHNWGDWYAFDNFTRIRVYGYEGCPYNLPIIVPN